MILTQVLAIPIVQLLLTLMGTAWFYGAIKAFDRFLGG